MNILIYFGNQLCPTNGGTERAACLISDYLARQGHQIYYLACKASDAPGAIKSSFLPENVEAPTARNIAAVQALVNEHHIDVIINEGGFGDAVFLLSHDFIPDSVRIITHIHFDPKGGDRSFYKTLYLPILGVGVMQGIVNTLKWIKSPYNRHRSIEDKKGRFKKMLETSDKIVVLSQKHRNAILGMIGNIHPEKIVTIQNPLSFSVCDSGESEKINEIIFVGRLDYKSKRVDRILNVWSKLHSTYNDWQLTIIGDGDDRNRLEKLRRKLNLTNINFEGQKDSRPYYMRAKILLMTSNYEGSPMVIPEAMAYGVVPVIMDTFATAGDIIKTGHNGFITKAYDIEDMKNSVERLIVDSNLLSSLSANAKSDIKSSDNNEILANWNRII